MNTNKNFEKISSENLIKAAGGIGIIPTGPSAEEIQKQIEEAERKEEERKKAEKLVTTWAHPNVLFGWD